MERRELTEKNITELIKEAIGYLGRSHAIIFPTDTLYALGADALNENAIKRFFSLKKRSANKPVSLFILDIKMAHKVAYIDRRQEEILEKLWPGPFTLVLEKRERISSLLSANTDKIGLRIPSNEFAYNLIKEFGRPIISSSANVSGMAPPQDLDGIIEQFKQKSITPEFIIDAGNLEEKDPSTVIDITQEKPKILRINQATLPALQKIFKKLSF